MSALSDKEKKELKNKWKTERKKSYILSKPQVVQLFGYIEERLEEYECDDTINFTAQWLSDNVSEQEHEAVLSEIEQMGGYCDCEVLLNCYEDYFE